MRMAGLFLLEARPRRTVFPALWQRPLCRTVLWGLPLSVASAGLTYMPFVLLRTDQRTLHELAAGTRFITAPEETAEE